VLREFRRNCKTLIALGACAVNGGLPAQRNHLPLSECLREVYQFRPGIANGQIPNDPELPLLLDKVRPIHEVVRSITSCPAARLRAGHLEVPHRPDRRPHAAAGPRPDALRLRPP
jgi:coenzyme F420-reducing hydrogenase gamma subunit